MSELLHPSQMSNKRIGKITFAEERAEVSVCEHNPLRLIRRTARKEYVDFGL